MDQVLSIISKISDRDLRDIALKFSRKESFMSDPLVNHLATMNAQNTGSYDLTPILNMIMHEIAKRWVATFSSGDVDQI